MVVRIETEVHRALDALEHAAAKVAMESTEEWRLKHAEFMDALANAGDVLRPLPVYSKEGEG